MKFSPIILMLLLSSKLVFAQNEGFVHDMEFALHIHDTASTVASEQKALDEFVVLTKKYQNEWLAFYWTAHLYGQTGRLYSTDNDKFKSYLNMAQEYYEKAWSLKKNKSKNEKSELYALQSLLYRLMSRANYDPSRGIFEDKKQSDKYVSLSTEYLQKAERENPNNPRVRMNQGITLISNRSYKEGVAVLYKAIVLFEKYPPKSRIHPSWGRAWIDAWLPRAEQGKRFVEDMEFALSIHDTASVIESEIQAAKKFEKLGQKYKGEWLPYYWATYLYTQIGRAADIKKKDVDQISFIDKAQRNFDIASKLLPNKSEEEKSDFHSLQALIYFFRGRFIEGTTAEKHMNLAEEEVNKAIIANPQNPLVYVLSATSWIRTTTNLGQSSPESDLRKVLAGNILLHEAKKKFENSRPERSMTTHWNQEWLPFWIPYSEKLLQKEEAKNQ